MDGLSHWLADLGTHGLSKNYAEACISIAAFYNTLSNSPNWA